MKRSGKWQHFFYTVSHPADGYYWIRHLQNGKSVDVCFYLEENSYRGRTTLQMNAQDVKLND